MKSLSFKASAFLTAFILTVFGLTGCGYTRQAALPGGIKTIYVATTQNRIPVNRIYAYQPGLEILISNSLVRRFKQDGNLEVVGSPAEADAVLETDLVEYVQDGLRFNSLETVEEYRLLMKIDFRLVNAKTDKVIFEEKEFSGDAEYFVSDVRSIGREEASKRAAERLARNVVDRIVEDW